MKRLKEGAGALPVSPVLFAASFVLTIYVHNIGDLTTELLTLPLSVAVAFAAAITVLVIAAFGDRVKGTVFAALSVILFMSYGAILPALSWIDFHIGRTEITGNGVLAVLSFACFIAFVRFVAWLKPSRLRLVYSYLLVVSACAAFIPLTQTVYYEAFRRSHSADRSPLALPKGIKPSVPPDIYYIVPDSYSAPAIFKTAFGYDNGAFADDLEHRGFYVVRNATSNYPKTYLSLTSTLNMEYLDYLSAHTDSSDESVVVPLLRDNNVLKFLRPMGYKYYQLGSWWLPTQFNRLANKNYGLDIQNPLGLNSFAYILADSTLLNPFISRFLPHAVITETPEDKRARSVYEFDTLPAVAKLPGPKFVFAHILTPHAPNVFGPNCEYISQSDLDGKTDEKGYTDQVRCVNTLITKTIDGILKNSARPPVILIQSDEGAPFLAGRLNPMDNWKTADTALLRKKFPVLAAYYLPGVTDSGLYPTVTSVNSFRIILNAYFDAKLPLLPDRNIIQLDMEHRYDFRDVTGTVQKR